MIHLVCKTLQLPFKKIYLWPSELEASLVTPSPTWPPNFSPYSLVILSVPLESHLSIQLKAATVTLGLQHKMDGDFLFPHFVQSSFVNGHHEDPAWKDPLNYTESACSLTLQPLFCSSVSQDLEIQVEHKKLP